MLRVLCSGARVWETIHGVLLVIKDLRASEGVEPYKNPYKILYILP